MDNKEIKTAEELLKQRLKESIKFFKLAVSEQQFNQGYIELLKIFNEVQHKSQPISNVEDKIQKAIDWVDMEINDYKERRKSDKDERYNFSIVALKDAKQYLLSLQSEHPLISEEESVKLHKKALEQMDKPRVMKQLEKIISESSEHPLKVNVEKILLAKAKELNVYVDFSDKTYDGDKNAPMDLIGFLVYLTDNFQHPLKVNVEEAVVEEISVKFFYWWYNQKGSNTVEGFKSFKETDIYKQWYASQLIKL